MIKHINSFNQIRIITKSLIVLDIDETIMAFPNITKIWWKDTFDKNFANTSNKKLAESLTIEDWKNHVSQNNPYLLDENQFNKFMKKINQTNCELVLLTARNKKITDLTHKHLYHCNIDINRNNVFHNENKGEALANIINMYPEINNIIFVDDFEKNLLSVKNKFSQDRLSHYNLSLYKISHN